MGTKLGVDDRSRGWSDFLFGTALLLPPAPTGRFIYFSILTWLYKPRHALSRFPHQSVYLPWWFVSAPDFDKSTMVALLLFFSSLLLVSSILASPISNGNRLRFPPVDSSKLLCQLLIAKKFLCPHTGSNPQSIDTAFGTAFGTADPSGATRFVVKYASANRWAPSTLVTNWSLP